MEEKGGLTQLLTRAHVPCWGSGGRSKTGDPSKGCSAVGNRPTACGPYRESSALKNVGSKDQSVYSFVRLNRSAHTLSAVGIHSASRVTPSRCTTVYRRRTSSQRAVDRETSELTT